MGDELQCDAAKTNMGKHSLFDKFRRDVVPQLVDKEQGEVLLSRVVYRFLEYVAQTRVTAQTTEASNPLYACVMILGLTISCALLVAHFFL